MGSIPTVLNIPIQTNHASWLARADFQNAISFHTLSQIASIMKTAIIQGFSEIKDSIFL